MKYQGQFVRKESLRPCGFYVPSRSKLQSDDKEVPVFYAQFMRGKSILVPAS